MKWHSFETSHAAATHGMQTKTCGFWEVGVGMAGLTSGKWACRTFCSANEHHAAMCLSFSWATWHLRLLHLNSIFVHTDHV